MTDPDAEFEFLASRAGLTIPAERRDAVLTAWRDMREQIALLHAPLDPALEPSNVFRLTPRTERA